MAGSSPEKIIEYCKDVLAPVVQADGGELYLVSADDTSVALHLGGRCGGCPGRTIAAEQLLKPALQSVAPDVVVHVSYGVKLPEGATLL